MDLKLSKKNEATLGFWENFLGVSLNQKIELPSNQYRVELSRAELQDQFSAKLHKLIIKDSHAGQSHNQKLQSINGGNLCLTFSYSGNGENNKRSEKQLITSYKCPAESSNYGVMLTLENVQTMSPSSLIEMGECTNEEECHQYCQQNNGKLVSDLSGEKQCEGRFYLKQFCATYDLIEEKEAGFINELKEGADEHFSELFSPVKDNLRGMVLHGGCFTNAQQQSYMA